MIVKVQVPLFSTEEAPDALVYDRGRKFVTFMPVTADILKAMRGRPKAFFHAEFDEKRNQLLIGEDAGWREW